MHKRKQKKQRYLENQNFENHESNIPTEKFITNRKEDSSKIEESKFGGIEKVKNMMMVLPREKPEN